MTEPADLYQLLAIPADSDTDVLRYTYEQHVAATVRGHNQRRALALSAAFDQLPETTRQAVYSSQRPAGTDATAPAGRTWASPATGAEPDRPAGRSRPRPARQLRGRFVAALFLVPAAVIGIGVLVDGQFDLSQSSPPGPPTKPAIRPLTTVSAVVRPTPIRSTAPQPFVTGPVRVVPLTAPTGTNGFVQIYCPPTAVRPGYWQYGRTGQPTACINGATPYIPAP